MHVLTARTHASDERTRGLAVVGTSFLHEVAFSQALDVFRERGFVQVSISDWRKDRDSLAIAPMTGQAVVLAIGAVEQWEEQDIPFLSRLSRDTVILATGSSWGSERVKDWWNAAGHRKILDNYRTRSAGGKKQMEEWLTQAGAPSEVSRKACDRVGYDPELVYGLVARVSVLEPGTLSADDVMLLTDDFLSGDYVTSLLEFKFSAAVAAARRTPDADVLGILRTLAAQLALLMRINAVVVRFPLPCVQASKDSRVPLPTLTALWPVAGRYGPQETMARLDAVRYLSENAPLTSSTLVALAGVWG